MFQHVLLHAFLLSWSFKPKLLDISIIRPWKVSSTLNIHHFGKQSIGYLKLLKYLSMTLPRLYTIQHFSSESFFECALLLMGNTFWSISYEVLHRININMKYKALLTRLFIVKIFLLFKLRGSYLKKHFGAFLTNP